MSLLALALALAGCGSAASEMRLRRVVLYQNGVGYFERSGRVEGGAVALRLGSHEVDDVLTTLTVVDETAGSDSSTSPSAVVPSPAEFDDDDAVRTLTLDVGDEGPRDMRISYAAPTPVWRTTYRVVLDGVEAEQALIQAWAVVYNSSPEDWTDVELALATSAPFSFRVNLRDPRFADRPDANGRMGGGSAARVAVGSTHTHGAADQDADGILDVDDRCPEDPEVYNGAEDEDGCPDAGRVVISDSRIAILEQIYFAENASEVNARSAPILDAIAATLVGNPDITSVQVQGHASGGEDHAWALSAERAAVVRAALVERGVEAGRLTVQAFGDSQPIAPNDSAAGRERNRRASFHIAEGRDEGGADSASRSRGVSVRNVERTGQAAARASVDPSGATRYGLARHVSVPAGSSSMVTVLNERMAGARVLLFRPDGGVDGSHLHPMRAVRFENGAVDLVPGPVAIFAEGELLGQGLLDALPAERTAFIPYGLDASSEVRSEVQQDEAASALVSLRGSTLGVRNTQTRRTTYRVTPGARVPGRIYLTHRRAGGWNLGELPPGSETEESFVLAPIPLSAGQPSAVTVSELRSIERFINLSTDTTTDLAPYLAAERERIANDGRGPSQRLLTDEQLARFEALIAARVHVRERTSDEARLRRELADAASRNSEIRASLGALSDASRTAATRSLRRELTERLDAGVARVEGYSEQIAASRAERAQANDAVRQAVRAFSESLQVELDEEFREIVEE